MRTAGLGRGPTAPELRWRLPRSNTRVQALRQLVSRAQPTRRLLQTPRTAGLAAFQAYVRAKIREAMFSEFDYLV